MTHELTGRELLSSLLKLSEADLGKRVVGLDYDNTIDEEGVQAAPAASYVANAVEVRDTYIAIAMTYYGEE